MRVKPTQHILLIAAALILSVPVKAQLDTVHYLSPFHAVVNSQIEDHFIYLSTPESIPFTVTAKDGSGNTIGTKSFYKGF